MITPEKISTTNPFVDNLIYYAKFMALNASIKDEDEALSHETKESLRAGDVYIACIEKNNTYEMFKSIPKEILEKYIAAQSNLDLYVSNSNNLQIYLDSLGGYDKTILFNKLSSLARTVYIDHFDVILSYINTVGPTWIDDNRELYEKCKSGEATYVDLIDNLPIKTVARIIKKYLNSHDYLELSSLWDETHITSLEQILALVPRDGVIPTNAELSARKSDRNTRAVLATTNNIIDNIMSTNTTQTSSTSGDLLNQFQQYVDSRVDAQINEELSKISAAMRSVFIDHYDMMVDRNYFDTDINLSFDEDCDTRPEWMDYYYTNSIEVYKKCKDGTATYQDLYDLFPNYSLLDSLNNAIGESIVNMYDLTRSVDVLTEYFDSYSTDPSTEKQALNQNMISKYLKNYRFFMNTDMYFKCQKEMVDYFDLIEYLPIETQKSILATEIDEVTNLDVYSESKEMLNSYLATLSIAERNRIKQAINNDMQLWYPNNHVETNNYYRSFIGLPPLDDDGKQYEDTLYHTYDPVTKSFTEFGNRFINQIPEGIYPDYHWRQPICEFDSYDIGVLNEYGILQDYIAACGSSMSSKRYRYLKYLGDEKLDLYTCRKALNFQLIGIPTVDDSIVRNKFVDAYVVNRDYVIRAVYSDAYKFQSDYYNKFIIIFILINTIMDVLTGIPELIINRDVFDSRCIRYLFESFGIPYYSEIPVKYQQAMLKNLNTLIKYKSSTKNMIDICKLFGFSDIRVFGYYLMKDRVVDTNTGEFIFDENNDIAYDLSKIYVKDRSGGETIDITGSRFTKLLEYRYFDEDYYLKTVTVEDENGNTITKKIVRNDRDVYVYDTSANQMIPLLDSEYFSKIKADTKPATLKFVRVPIDEQLSEYKNDSNYFINYDETTLGELTWDGGLVHEELKQDILDYEFNAVKSKYISVETVTDMTELSFQVSYFYNMLFDNLYSEEALTVEVPYIKLDHKFKFMDIVCYLFALMYYYNGIEDNIMYSPTQILYVKGYNFNTDLNTILQDATAFTQEDEFGPLEDYEKQNIFDVNERIQQDGYDYRKTFDKEEYYIRGFNLEADIDAIEKWLNDEYQLSLEDFVVDDSFETFNQVITLKQFFSLNNSYYQKSIFRDNLLPLQYNNEIKYAFDYSLYEKEYLNDINSYTHEYVRESTGSNVYLMEVINDASEEVYILDNVNYASKNNANDYAIYRLFKRVDNDYVLADTQYYIFTEEDGYQPLFSGGIYVKNRNGLYVFSSNKIYRKNDIDEFVEVIEDQYYSTDTNGSKLLNLSDYYILKDGKYILDPENCYVIVTQNGESKYVLLKDIGDYNNQIISDDDCFIMHSDGHFIKFTDTDYYRRTKNSDEESEEMIYTEEDLFIISDTATQWYDPSATPTVYYKKLSDFYRENNYVIYKDDMYVKDPNGNYIPERDLLSPTNCYYKTNTGRYNLIINDFVEYKQYENPRDVQYVLVLQPNYDYRKLQLQDTTYANVLNNSKRYVLDSDDEYVNVLLLNDTATYAETNQMIVVLNRLMSMDSIIDEEDSKYNPSLHDDVWDENDWFYGDPSYDSNISIGMNGENIWYYRKPGTSGSTTQTEEETAVLVGSGWYMESTAYIGNVQLEKGEKYYMSFDIETNFPGPVQIYCEADESVVDTTQRVYTFKAGEIKHVNQVFIANDTTTPTLRFLKFDFENYPINPGDYMVISNIKFIKAYSENFIPTDIPSYDKLQEIYRTNEAIHKYLISLMNNTSDKKTYDIYKKLYDALMISKYNKEAFKIGENKYAKTYTEFLQSRDEVLFERLNYFKSLDEDAMHKEIADNIIEVSYAIDDCVDTYSYGYLYSYFPAVSASYIQQYISKIINFFKSWKVQLLGINTIYKFSDEFENTLKVLEDQEYRVRLDEEHGRVFIYGEAKVNPLDSVNPSGIPYVDLFDLEDPTNKYSDKVRIRDRVRVISRTANNIRFTDNYDNMHLILNNTDTTVKTDNDNLVINSSTDSFRTANLNQLLMTTDETDQDLFASQIIEEINLLSGDYIDYDELEDDDE